MRWTILDGVHDIIISQLTDLRVCVSVLFIITHHCLQQGHVQIYRVIVLVTSDDPHGVD